MLLGSGLVKVYDDHRALDGVDFEVASGGLVAVMGPSGSGKSTLLHVLAGLTTPTEGEVMVDGVALSSLSDDGRSEFRRRHIGIVFQSFNLVPVLTVEENVALPAVISGERPAVYQERVDQLVATMGLQKERRRLPSELSGGQQQRVALARAFVMQPAVVLADEPTGNLDTATGQAVMEEFVRANRDRGQAVVVVSHDPAIASLCNTVILLRDGRVADRVEMDGEGGDRAQHLLAWLQERTPALRP